MLCISDCRTLATAVAGCRRRERQQVGYSRLLLISAVAVAVSLGAAVERGYAQSWTNHQLMDVGLIRHVAAAGTDINGVDRIFVFGGGSENTAYSRNDAYDPITNTWDTTSFAPLPTRRVLPTETVGHDCRIYVIGGFNGGLSSLVLYSIVEAYDPATDTWDTSIPSMNVGRSAPAAATGPDGKIYVFGGHNPNSAGFYNSVEMYDPSNPTGGWTMQTPMPVGHYHIGAETGCNGKIYVMGRDESDWNVAFNYEYDPAAGPGGSWAIKTPCPATGPALAGRGMTRGPDGQIYLINDGEYNTSNDPRVWAYEPTTDTWTSVPNSIRGYTALAAATLGDRVYAIGGSVRFSPELRRTESFGPIAPGGACPANPCTTVKCAPPPSGMVAWWTMDGYEDLGVGAAGVNDVRDIAGNEVHGDAVGAPSLQGGEMVRSSLCFNGTNQYIEVPDSPAINFGTGDLSIDAWIRTTQASGVRKIVDKRVVGSSTTGYSMFLSNGVLFFQLADGSGSSSCNYCPTTASCTNWGSGVFVATGEWTHVAVTVARVADGGTFYVDGVPVSTFDPDCHPLSVTNSSPLRIASRSAVVGGLFAGCIDEVELFNRELTAAEVHSIFYAGSEGKCRCEPLEDGTGCTEGGCPNNACRPTCWTTDPATGRNKVTQCECVGDGCHSKFVPQGDVSCSGGCTIFDECSLEPGDADLEFCCDCTPLPTGACCLPHGNCEQLPQDVCADYGGYFHGEGVPCQGDEDDNGIDDLCECRELQGADGGEFCEGTCGGYDQSCEYMYGTEECGCVDCEPLPDGSACQHMECSDPSETCMPTKIYIDPCTDEVTVLECDCRSENSCHVTYDPTTGADPVCTGGCPPFRTCRLRENDDTFWCQCAFIFIAGDIDLDGDVDLADYAILQVNLTGPRELGEE